MLLFSHNDKKCRSGSKAFHWHGSSAGAELTVSLSSGQEQLGKPVLPATRILPRPDAFANSSPAAMCSGDGSSLLCCGIARGFQQVFICKTHPWISLKFRGKSAPEGLGGYKSPRPGPLVSLGGPEAQLPAGRGQQPGGCAGASPGPRPVLPRAPPPAADVVTAGTLAPGTQRGGFPSRSKADSCVLSEMVIIRSVPTIACGKNLPVLGEKTRSREKAT